MAYKEKCKALEAGDTESFYREGLYKASWGMKDGILRMLPSTQTIPYKGLVSCQRPWHLIVFYIFKCTASDRMWGLLVTVLLLWKDTMTKATLKKKTFNWRSAYSFRGLVQDHDDGETDRHGIGAVAEPYVLILRQQAGRQTPGLV